MQNSADTIVAISSPLTAWQNCIRKSDVPRSIVRLSGTRALALADGVFKSAESINSAASNCGGWRRIGGEIAWHGRSLSATVYVMRAPRSYTREDVIELHLPALGPVISDILEKLIAGGARLAQPGEFTRRALQNRRIKIEQAEAIGALISSQSADEARVHAARLVSHAGASRRSLRNEIEDLLSLVELGLDFSHEDVGVLSIDEIIQRLKSLHQQAESNANGGVASGESIDNTVLSASLPRILLLGPTNAGKSSLFNCLLATDAAIVSDRRHTTRDVVEAPLRFKSDTITALLQDSAGWGGELVAEKNPNDWLRKAAWNATQSAARAADVLLLVFDSTAGAFDQIGSPHEEFARLLSSVKPASIAVVWTKTDLFSTPHPEFESTLNAITAATVPIVQHFQSSSVNGRGIAELTAFLMQQTQQIGSRRQESEMAATVAARATACTAAEALLRAIEGLRSGHGEDVVAVELREAIHAYWQAEGVLMRHDAVTEAALDRIFSRFCIGK